MSVTDNDNQKSKWSTILSHAPDSPLTSRRSNSSRHAQPFRVLSHYCSPIMSEIGVGRVIDAVKALVTECFFFFLGYEGVRKFQVHGAKVLGSSINIC